MVRLLAIALLAAVSGPAGAQDDENDLARFRQDFRAVDRDSDGVISAPELQALLMDAERAGPALRKAESLVLMQRFDHDHDHRINVSEFLASVVHRDHTEQSAAVGCTCSTEYCQLTNGGSPYPYVDSTDGYGTDNRGFQNPLCSMEQVIVEMETHHDWRIQMHGCNTLAALLSHDRRRMPGYRADPELAYHQNITARAAAVNALNSYPSAIAVRHACAGNLLLELDWCTEGHCGEHGKCDAKTGRCECSFFYLPASLGDASSNPTVAEKHDDECYESLWHCLRSSSRSVLSCFERSDDIFFGSSLLICGSIICACCVCPGSCRQSLRGCCYPDRRRRLPPGLRRRRDGDAEGTPTPTTTRAAPLHLIDQLRKTVCVLLLPSPSPRRETSVNGGGGCDAVDGATCTELGDSDQQQQRPELAHEDAADHDGHRHNTNPVGRAVDDGDLENQTRLLPPVASLQVSAAVPVGTTSGDGGGGGSGSGLTRPGNSCVVCLESFLSGEELIVLPQCKHRFHSSCISQWLCQANSCPSCRSLAITESSSGSGGGGGGGGAARPATRTAGQAAAAVWGARHQLAEPLLSYSDIGYVSYAA